MKFEIGSSDGETDVEEQERLHKEEFESSPFGGTVSEYSMRDEEIEPLESFSLANWDDETSMSLREQVRNNKRILALFSVFSGLMFIVLVMWIMPFLPAFTDLWTWGVVLIPMSIVGIMLAGRRSLIDDLTGYTWLMVWLENDLYMMVVEPTGSGSKGAETFEIYKGWSKFGYKPRKLLYADLSVKLSRLVYNDAEDDTPAKIRLKSEHTKKKQGTLLGEVLVTRGRELDYDTKAEEAVLTVKRPNSMDEEEFQEVSSRLDTMTTLLKKEEMRAEAMEVESERAYSRQMQQRERLMNELRQLSNIVGHSPSPDPSIGNSGEDEESEELEKGEYIGEPEPEQGGDMS